MLNTIIKMMFQQLDYIEELADDDDDDAKSDLFEDPTQANLNYSEGKFVRRGNEFHIEVPSDDEVYSMSKAIMPMPTSQTYIWQNDDGGGVMPYNNFSSSSGPSTYHLPLETGLSDGIVRGRLSLSAANSLNHHAPESSTQLHDFPFPSFFWDDRNPLSLEDSLEPGNAAGDRDDIMSDSTFGAEYSASISDLFSDRGTDLLADKDLPLAHSQPAGRTHQRPTIVLKTPLAASEARRLKPGRFRCSLCPQDFTSRHNLMSKGPTLQIFVALSLMSISDHINSHFGRKAHSCHDCGRAFTTQSVLNRHRKTCKKSQNRSIAGTHPTVKST